MNHNSQPASQPASASAMVMAWHNRRKAQENLMRCVALITRMPWYALRECCAWECISVSPALSLSLSVSSYARSSFARIKKTTTTKKTHELNGNLNGRNGLFMKLTQRPVPIITVSRLGNSPYRRCYIQCNSARQHNAIVNTHKKRRRRNRQKKNKPRNRMNKLRCVAMNSTQ